ncbi:MAG: hypothetical protein ABSB99_10400 [Acidimicrobiales bacterium]|jgi:hypothetical protein
MTMQEPMTLRVVTAGEIVEAECAPSGVPGLALVGRPVTTRWRLVHMATGRAVSRSAEHADPEAVRDFARRIAHLTDWTDPNVAVSVPRLRQNLEQAITAWRAAYPPAEVAQSTPPQGIRRAEGVRRTEGVQGGQGVAGNGVHGPVQAERSNPPSVAGPDLAMGRDLAKDLERLATRLRVAEHERVLLRQVVRRLHAVLPADAFSDALATLSQSDRAFVRFLMADENAEDTTAVVQVIKGTDNVVSPRAPVSSTRLPTTASRPAAASPRNPTRPRKPHFGGPDVAAS